LGGNGIGKEIVDGLKSSPDNRRNAHATGFVGGQKDGRLGLGSSLTGRRLLGPFINDMDFSMKQGTLGFGIRIAIDAFQLVIQNGRSKDLVAIQDAFFRFWQDFVLNDL
jgi:hypothetical protein